MNDSETYEYEGRRYIQPTLSSGEQEAFIDNLRDVQKQNNAQIAQQTQNLGTNVPSNLGGLGGGEAYFTSRYQTPQVNEMTNNLKAAAQAQALNDVMTNYQNQLQNRYKQAYRRAQKRAAARANSGGTNLNDLLGSLLKINTNPKKQTEEGGDVDVNNTGNTANDGSNDVPMGLKMIMGGGSSNLGVWPNGTKMTPGSTYNWGGHTYGIGKNSRNEFDVIRIK